MKRLKTTQIAEYKKKLLILQDYKCGICEIDMSELPTRDLCLDHCRVFGHVRSVLCRNCNGIEGKIYNLANRGKRGRTVHDFLQRVQEYWNTHSNPEDPVFHPNHRTEDEKRLERNRKARMARARKKAAHNLKGS